MKALLMLAVTLVHLCVFNTVVESKPLSYTGDQRRIAVISDKSQLWPNAEVPYYFDGSLPQETVNLVHEVVKYYEEKTCVKFKEVDKSAGKAVRFFKGTGCNSSVGDNAATGASAHEISLGENCDRKGIIMHEMMHTLGFYHEQSRPDRDDYVTVKTDLIKPEYMRSFNINKDAETFGTPYDYNSIMHLHSRAFTKEKGVITIETKDKSKQELLGQRQGPSDLDLYGINRRYDCTDKVAELEQKLKSLTSNDMKTAEGSQTSGQNDDLVGAESIDTTLTTNRRRRIPENAESSYGKNNLVNDAVTNLFQRRRLRGSESARMKLLRRLAAASNY